MILIGKSGTAFVHNHNYLIESLDKDIKIHGNFLCWYFFKIVDGIKLYTSYQKIKDYRTEAIWLSECHKDGEYFESIRATDLLKILKKRNKIE